MEGVAEVVGTVYPGLVLLAVAGSEMIRWKYRLGKAPRWAVATSSAGAAVLVLPLLAAVVYAGVYHLWPWASAHALAAMAVVLTATAAMLAVQAVSVLRGRTRRLDE